MAWLTPIDPHAWMVTLPVVVGLLAAWVQPEGGTVKRWFAAVRQAEADAWTQLAGRTPPLRGDAGWQRGLLCSATTALALATMLSMATFLGLLG